ncbi:hypothetical protein NDU88_002460 [Pleurodeles waltl]|uniref:Secreted protein n=1 Tax=Pleurodeles waltl TaxID=8319 RepID=A0AAV7KVR7_PLEWA|nr:hypothetical protein NDU88_002460 [Pleurodeles waltl]
MACPGRVLWLLVVGASGRRGRSGSVAAWRVWVSETRARVDALGDQHLPPNNEEAQRLAGERTRTPGKGNI